MARDYLAVPAASVASERVFSSMRHIGTDFRNRLRPRMFEDLQMLKAGYKEGDISAAEDISKLPEIITIDDVDDLFSGQI